jgi:aspartate-semialdehyde dehydrogenase
LANLKPEMDSLNVALVGGDTLLGRELQDVLGRRLTGVPVRSYAPNAEGNFADQEGEAVYLEPFGPTALQHGSAVVFAGTGEGAEKVYTLAKEKHPQPYVIDTTGLLEHHEEARVISPFLAEPDLKQTWLWEMAHPAAAAIALTISKLSQYAGVKHVVGHVLEPASERGQKGVSELHQQTTDLLSFKPLKKDVFDAQASFNLLPQYGSDSKINLLDIETRIERHLTSLLGASIHPRVLPLPSVRLVQAPVFHGYSISLWVEFSSHVVPTELIEPLSSAHIEVRTEGQDAPNNVEAATQSGLIVGDIREDRTNRDAVWLWLVADNLRLVADGVADVLERIRTSLR